MSCNVCTESNINLYKCNTCTGQLCGDCLTTWDKGCPCCRKPMNYKDPNCTKLTINKEIDNRLKHLEVIEKVEIMIGIELSIHYCEIQDKWILDSDYDYLDIDDDDKEVRYVRAYKDYKIVGVKKPNLKDFKILYQGQQCKTVEIKHRHYTEKYHKNPLLELYGYNLGSVSHEFREHKSPIMNHCNYCNKSYLGLKTLENHLNNHHIDKIKKGNKFTLH